MSNSSKKTKLESKCCLKSLTLSAYNSEGNKIGDFRVMQTSWTNHYLNWRLFKDCIIHNLLIRIKLFSNFSIFKINSDDSYVELARFTINASAINRPTTLGVDQRFGALISLALMRKRLKKEQFTEDWAKIN